MSLKDGAKAQHILRASKTHFIVASHGFARCSSHDFSILLPHLLSSLRAQCIYLEPVLFTEYATPRACGSSGGVAENALPTGHEPNKLDSKTCIDVSSEYTPSNIAVRRENVNIEDDFLKIRRYPRIRTFCIERQLAANDVLQVSMPALRNLDLMSSTEKSVRGYETIVQSFSSIGKPMQGNRAFTSTGKPLRSDESVASVERNVSRTQVDRDHNSANRFGLREYLERKAEIAIQGEE